MELDSTTRRSLLAAGAVAATGLTGCIHGSEADPEEDTGEQDEDTNEQDDGGDADGRTGDFVVESDGSHTLSVVAGEDFSGGDSLNEVRAEYASADLSDVDDFQVYIDEEGDGEDTDHDVDATDDVDDVSTEDDGQTLVVTLGGVHNVEEGDRVVATYTGVQNSEEGETVDASLNDQDSVSLSLETE